MKTRCAGLFGLGIAAALAAISACGQGSEPRQGPSAANGLAGLDALIQMFDADLGDEGVPVDRSALEAALSADAELRLALLMPVEAAFTTGAGQ